MPARFPALRGGAWRRRVRLADESGVTLVELLTVITMLGITFTAAYFFYASVLNRTEATQARSNTQADLTVASERIAREVREARSVSAPALGEDGNRLALAVPTADGTLDQVVYDCEGVAGTCRRSVNGGGWTEIVSGLDTGAPVFRSFNASPGASSPDYVAIDLRQTPADRDAPIALERGVALRNYCTDPDALPADCD